METFDSPLIMWILNTLEYYKWKKGELRDNFAFYFLPYRFGLKTEEQNGGVKKDFHLLSETLKINLFHTVL